MSADDEKYDDDVTTQRGLEELARGRAGEVADYFVGDRALDYYLGFLRASSKSAAQNSRS